MKGSQIFFSTIAPDAGKTAREFQLGLEIAQFCTAFNIDRDFDRTDREIRTMLTPGQRTVYHAPFNELFPCAIDPMARELAAFRYRQAIGLAKGYGASKVVIHGGYHPKIYFPEWYVEQSILFWKEFMAREPGVDIVLENVLEPEKSWLGTIVREVGHPRFQMCLDIGHVNAYSPESVFSWLEENADCIGHFHIHNNDRSWDTHMGLDQGTIPMAEFLRRAQALCPEATFTMEVMDCASAAAWLKENHFI